MGYDEIRNLGNEVKTLKMTVLSDKIGNKVGPKMIVVIIQFVSIV